MDDSHRPVKLRKVVLGFPKGKNYSDFQFDLSLNYKLSGIIQTYSDRKPTLVVRKINLFICFAKSLSFGSHRNRTKLRAKSALVLLCFIHSFIEGVFIGLNKRCYQSTQHRKK